MTKKKGFIFIETIVVVAVLTVSLIMTYSTYTSSIMKENNRLYYDDPAYLYKSFYLTKFFRGYSLDLIASIIADDNAISPFSCQNDGIFVDNSKGKTMCEVLVTSLNVDSMVLTYNDLSDLQDNINSQKAKSISNQVDENMLNYLRTIGGDKQNGYRIVVRYASKKDGNACSDNEKCIYNYATISLGDV